MPIVPRLDIKSKGVLLLYGDCLERMLGVQDTSVDMVLCDPPYGTTACKWDTVIPFEPMWKQLKRICKPNAAIVMTSSQPFTTSLIDSNRKMFRYCWVWDKKKPSNFPLAKKQPMKYHEDIVVFGIKSPVYIPIMVPVPGRKAKKGVNENPTVFPNGLLNRRDYLDKVYTDKYPSSIIEISNADQTNRVHPTQKPVALMEYLVKTYTKEGETVLDFAMGSGTTGVACRTLNRNFIGIELEGKFFDIASQRILGK